MASRRRSHDSFTLPAQLHSQAGWGPEQPQALPGLLYTILWHVWQQRATPRAAGEQHSLPHDPFAMVFILHLLLPLLFPTDFLLWDSSSATAKWALRLHFEGMTLGSSYLWSKSQCCTLNSQEPIQVHIPWSPNLTVFLHSLTGLLFLLWKYPFSRVMNSQHWGTSAAWSKMSPNLQQWLHWNKHVIRGLFRLKVKGVSLGLCLLKNA